MSRQDLMLHYYYGDNGEKDEVAFLISNCFAQNVYVVLKNEYGKIANPFTIFLDDINLCIFQKNDNSIKDIWMIRTGINKDIYRWECCDEMDAESLHTLERLLDNGEKVIFQTVNQKLPYSRFYNPDFTPEDYTMGHGFLAIWHDSENVYFVDSPELINYKYFTPYKENKEVGIISKKLLADLSRYYSRCYRIFINEDKLLKAEQGLKNIIRESVDNYNKEVDFLNSEGLKISSGREAINRLIEICNEGSIRLDDIAPHKRSFYDFFDWKMRSAINQRKLLVKCIGRYIALNKSFDKTEIVGVINDTINIWEKSFRVMKKRYYSKTYLLDESYKKYLLEILDSEDRQNIYLKNFLSVI